MVGIKNGVNKMKFGEFLTSKVHGSTIVKVIWPERGKISSGYPADYKSEQSMLNANVFDLLITPGEDYHVMVWLTTCDITML